MTMECHERDHTTGHGTATDNGPRNRPPLIIISPKMTPR